MNVVKRYRFSMIGKVSLVYTVRAVLPRYGYLKATEHGDPTSSVTGESRCESKDSEKLLKLRETERAVSQ